MSNESTLEDLEIIAGHAWSAVGGVDQGSVQVNQVDPKRFGVEIAAATAVTWIHGEEATVKQAVLATLRPFKPMDMIITETIFPGETTVPVSAAGISRIRGVDIGGVQQFTSKNPVRSLIFGSLLTAPRPKIRFDTVQTSPSLTADLDLGFADGTTPVIGASQTVGVELVFGGVAVKR